MVPDGLVPLSPERQDRLIRRRQRFIAPLRHSQTPPALAAATNAMITALETNIVQEETRLAVARSLAAKARDFELAELRKLAVAASKRREADHPVQSDCASRADSRNAQHAASIVVHRFTFCSHQ